MSRLRWLTAGESHGPELTALVCGIPAGLTLLAEQVDADLARRQVGYGRGGRMKIESDRVKLTGGVRGGETLGGPISLTIENRDHANWLGRMGAAPFVEPPERVTRPRPGHADLAGGQKYARRDLRDILERASARETAARVAVGAICKQLLLAVGVRIGSYVVAIEGVRADPQASLSYESRFELAEQSDVRCLDPAIAEQMRAAIHQASHQGDTVGGIFEVVALGLPPGLGSHAQWDRKLDGRLAQALMSIQAIKGVEIGLGFEAAALRGSAVHDEIVLASEGGITRRTNGAGGLEGGITNGMPLVCRAAMKPISTLRKELCSVDIDTKQEVRAAHERSDICAVPAAAVVGEAMLAVVLADALLEKFGGDSLLELKHNVESYERQLAAY